MSPVLAFDVPRAKYLRKRFENVLKSLFVVMSFACCERQYTAHILISPTQCSMET